MPTLKPSGPPLLRSLWISVLALAAFLAGCSVLGWREVYSCAMPGGKRSATVSENCGLSDCTVRVVVDGARGPTEIALRRGCNIYFAHAAWVGSVVGVFVDGGTCQTIGIAYDSASDTRVPFQAVEATLRASIGTDYGVGPKELAKTGGDVLAWATYPGDGSQRRSMVDFRKRHPH